MKSQINITKIDSAMLNFQNIKQLQHWKSYINIKLDIKMTKITLIQFWVSKLQQLTVYTKN